MDICFSYTRRLLALPLIASHFLLFEISGLHGDSYITLVQPWVPSVSALRAIRCESSADFPITGIPLSIAALVFVGGGIVMQLLVIMSGSSAGYPTNQIYMLQAATDNIPTQRNPTRWTFLGMCGSDGGPTNTDCAPTGAAPPFNPPQNFATTVQVPWQFMETARFFYLSKAMFGMYLMAILFSVLCMALSIPALFGVTGAFKGGFSIMLACLFQALSAALMT